MSQESLDFGRLYRVRDGVRAVYRALNNAVDQVGIVVAAGACGIDRGDLRRALDHEDRRVAVEHAIAIAAVAPRSTCDTIVTPIGTTLGYEWTDERPPLSDKERADRAEAALLALGPIGQQALRDALGGRR